MLQRLLRTFFSKGDTGAAAPYWSGSDAIDAYVASHAVRKLHLGAGLGSAPGWLATDITPRAADIAYLDATAPFPIDDATFDYVFSEHMIEHITWREGAFMLRECHRIMRPGGTIRIATPDLAVMLGLYTSEGDEMAERYVRWITDCVLPDVGAYRPAFVINNVFRAWGHQFLYDGELLERALREAGFVDVRPCAYGESADDNLRGIECHGRNIGDESIAVFETMVYEADRR